MTNSCFGFTSFDCLLIMGLFPPKIVTKYILHKEDKIHLKVIFSIQSKHILLSNFHNCNTLNYLHDY